jgi:WhiB family redox-sensing transcriptional regulator
VKELDLQEALCAEVGTEMFFPENGNRHMLVAARKVCAKCPIAEACLEEALTQPYIEDHGIWGGSSSYQRKLMRSNPKLKTVHLQELRREGRK